MKNKIITLAIIREARIDESRTPLSPTQISNLLNIDLEKKDIFFHFL